MTRRSMKIGFLALLVTTVIGGAIFAHRAANAFGHHRKTAIIKRVISAHIDEILADAKVNEAQRQTVYAARDRVYTAFENHHDGHRAHMEEALKLFEADRVDPNQLAGLRAQREAEVAKLSDVVTQALLEVHDTLTPQQRRVVTEELRAMRAAHAD